MMKGPIDTPSSCDIGGTKGGPGIYDGEPGLPKRSGYSTGVTELTYETEPARPDLSGRLVEPILPPLFKDR